MKATNWIVPAALAVIAVTGTAQGSGDPYGASPYTDKYMRGAAAAFQTKRTGPLALFLDEIVPQGEQWTIVLDETMQNKVIDIPSPSGDWRAQLQATLAANGMTAAIDDPTRIVAVSSTGANAIALLRGYQPSKPAAPSPPPAPADELAGLGPVDGGSVAPMPLNPAQPMGLDPLPESALDGLGPDLGEVPPRLMSVEEFNNEIVSIDLANVSVDTALRAALPQGWRIVLPEGGALDARLVSANTETTRGQVLAELSRELRLQFFPFPNKGVLMARETK